MFYRLFLNIFTKFTGKHLCCGLFLLKLLKDTQKAFDDIKNKQKSDWSNAFWYVTVYIYSERSFNTIYIKIKQMLKKIPSDKINVIKNALLFLLQAPTHHRLTFDSRSLSDLKHKLCLSKSGCEIFHFWFCLLGYLLGFIMGSSFCFPNVKIPFKIKTIEKSHSLLRSSHQMCSAKKVFLEISQNSQENTYARVSFLIKLFNKVVNFETCLSSWEEKLLHTDVPKDEFSKEERDILYSLKNDNTIVIKGAYKGSGVNL